MTQTEFDQLPALLSSFQVCQLSGMTRNELRAEVSAGQIKTFRPAYIRKGCKSARPKYIKASVAKRFGLKL